MNSVEFVSALDKHFDFKSRESELYSLWEKAGLFKPESAPDQKAAVFNISMPPPNANGELHLGHSFGYTVMDILGRFHRMRGERVLLLPGKDHAGIQTQVVFEKKLEKEGVKVKEQPIEELYQQCYDFCIDRSAYMRAQEKRLGLSADWSRELFTLDPRLNKIVFETFEKLWRDGLIYKGKRIVNWSVFSQTAISDVEVEYKEQDGSLWYIVYRWADESTQAGEAQLKLPNGTSVRVGEGGLMTATTRPETMLGDTALVVHPDDSRYQKYIGKEAIVPLINRRIKVIADKRVDPTFGTGVIKVTPAHDFADYDMGVDHKLEMIQVVGKDGRMTEEAGADFVGLPANKCRASIVERLEAAGQLLDTAKIKHKVPIGERGKDIIEPLISEQWFINVGKPGNSLKGKALELVRSGKVKIYPERFQVLFEQWLENLRDWNISRQLWWGHRLPVWYKRTSGNEETYVGVNPPSGAGWEQEKDIFDTWFSSGQWAFSTMAAHEFLNLDKPESKNNFFPTHTMVMGRDILFFWACRMLLLTAYRLGDVPWRNIFFTGLIRDEHGQKMSKSKGNGIDPLDIVDRFGADSLRLGLVMGATPGNDIALSERKIEGYSKFINKIWNAAKLLEFKLGAIPEPSSAPELKLESSKWILAELAKIHSAVTAKLEQYEISIAADELYNFTWTVFCDWYLEIMKVLVDKGDPEWRAELRYVSLACFRMILRLLHPFIPFVTEEIHQKLGLLKDTPTLFGSSWEFTGLKCSVESPQLRHAMEVVSAIRSVKAALAIPQKRIRAAIAESYSAEHEIIIKELARVDYCAAGEIPSELALRKPYSQGVLVLEVEGKENYRQRLEKDVEMHRGIISDLEKKLSGSFASQAKPEIVEKERERLETSKRTVLELERELKTIFT